MSRVVPALRDLPQRRCVEVMELVATLPSRSHEARRLEDVEVLRDRLSGRTQAVLRGEPGADLEQRLPVPFRELVEDRAACGIGECFEHVTQDAHLRQVATCLSSGSETRVASRTAVWNHEAVVEVVVLGSGTPNPDPNRAGAAVAVVDGASWVLVDCGRAATQRALSAGLDLRRLRAVFLTHHHSDHVSDLATLATTRWVSGDDTPLRVVTPAGPAERYAERCLDVFGDEAFHGQATPSARARPTIAVDAFEPGPDVEEVFADDDWRVVSVLVDHHPVKPAVGYTVERAGIRVAISGDTAVCEGVRRLAHGADVVVHEALLTAAVSPSLLEWNAGARSVGALASSTQPATLILTHLIPAPRTVEDERAFLDEVREGGFTGHTVIAHDLLRLPVS